MPGERGGGGGPQAGPPGGGGVWRGGGGGGGGCRGGGGGGGGGEGHQQGATAEWTLVLGGRCLLGGPDPRYIKHIIETPRYGIIYMVVCVCV